MKDTYYFSHDYNPRGDEKIQGLLFEMGWEGYGLYWGLVELLYQNDGYLQFECKRIAFELRTDCDKIEKLINDFNLFMINDNMFTSKSVLHRLKKRKEKTLQTRKAAKIRWDKEKQDDANAMQTESESNAIKVKESKVKESKVNKIEFTNFWDLYDKKKGKKEKIEIKWNKLSLETQKLIIEHIPKYKKEIPEKQFRKHPETYLNNETWKDEIIEKKEINSIPEHTEDEYINAKGF